MRNGLVHGSVTAIIIIAGTSCGAAKELQKELHMLDNLRKGRQTPLDLVDERGAQLLKQYTSPKDQALIHFQLAHVHAQSGLLQPDKIIEYAQRALEGPLEPGKRARMHVYWGDALRVLRPRQSFTTTRKEAATIYLRGLKDVLALGLPEQLPKLAALPENASIEDVFRYIEERKALDQRTELQREMIQHRDVLTRQVVSMYARWPYATEELEQLAHDTLEDPKAVERLKKSLLPEIEKDKRQRAALKAKNEAGRTVLPPAGADTRWTIYIIIGGVSLLALVSFFLIRAKYRATAKKS